jgi:hypothetical protein
MSIKKIDDLYILSINKISNNLIHSDDLINNIIHNVNYCIFDSTIDFIYIDYKKIIINKPYDSEIINEIKNYWEKINIYENIGIHSIFLNYNNLIYFYDIYEQTLILIDKINYIKHYYDKLNIVLNINKVIQINIVLNKYTHLLYYKNSDIVDTILINKKDNIYFSCFDEFIFDLESLSKQNENKKKLTINGYIINYNNIDLDLIIFRMKMGNRIIPKLKTDNFYICDVGRSFVMKKKIYDHGTKFIPDGAEDYLYLNNIRKNGYKIMISPHIKYFVRPNTENNQNEMEVSRYLPEFTKENTENNQNEMKVSRYLPEFTKENTENNQNEMEVSRYLPEFTNENTENNHKYKNEMDLLEDLYVDKERCSCEKIIGNRVFINKLTSRDNSNKLLFKCYVYLYSKYFL